MQHTHLVGISGLPRSGKDALAEEFVRSGYYGVSFGDIVREFTRGRHHDKPDPISVANMTETANWLRETKGADVVLKEALNRYEAAKQHQQYKGLVLFSVRAPVEADFILSHGGELIWVEASDEVRHARNLKHQRSGEAPVDLTEFKRQEDLQWQPQPGVPPEAQMNVSYVRQKATRQLENNSGDLQTFLANAQKLIQELQAQS